MVIDTHPVPPVVFNDWGTSRPCLFPPMAVKSKPPALRVAVDSNMLMIIKNITSLTGLQIHRGCIDFKEPLRTSRGAVSGKF